jgi:hypothetical protein
VYTHHTAWYDNTMQITINQSHRRPLRNLIIALSVLLAGTAATLIAAVIAL